MLLGIGGVHLEGLLESVDVILPSGMLVAIDLADPSWGGELHLKVIGGSNASEKIGHTPTNDGII